MKKYLIFAIVLPLLTIGCVAHRIVEVDITRIEVNASQSNKSVSVFAVDSFRDVANQLGFIVNGPIQNLHTDKLSFNAGPSRTNIVSLSMDIDDKNVNFISGIVGTKEDFIAAQKAAILFEQALDKRGIQYKVVTRTDFLGP